jgi:hypothetical protein
MASIPAAVNASRTASSLKGLTIAKISFIGRNLS